MRHASFVNGIVVTAVLTLGMHPTYAFKDDKEQIAQQWQRHSLAIRASLRAFASGDLQAQSEAVTAIATSEAYLAILGAPADDPRLVAWLFDGQLDLSERISRLYHHLLKEQTGFEPSLLAIARQPAFR